MPRQSINAIAATTEAVKKKIKEGKGLPPKEWRVAGHTGLVLVTRPTGAGVFFLIYRPHIGGKQRKFRIGAFGPTTLADATAKALGARAEISQGKSPADDRARQRASLTFKEVAEKFISAEGPLKANTRQTYRWTLDRDVYPAFGDKPATAITADDVHNVCVKIKARGSDTQAQRTKTTIGGVFAWGKRERFVTENPARAVANQQSRRSVRTCTPSDDELTSLWQSLDKPSRLTLAMKLIIRLAILTGQRRSEVAGTRPMSWLRWTPIRRLGSSRATS